MAPFAQGRKPAALIGTVGDVLWMAEHPGQLWALSTRTGELVVPPEGVKAGPSGVLDHRGRYFDWAGHTYGLFDLRQGPEVLAHARKVRDEEGKWVFPGDAAPIPMEDGRLLCFDGVGTIYVLRPDEPAVLRKVATVPAGIVSAGVAHDRLYALDTSGVLSVLGEA